MKARFAVFGVERAKYDRKSFRKRWLRFKSCKISGLQDFIIHQVIENKQFNHFK